MNQIFHKTDAKQLSKLVADLSDSKFLAKANQDPVEFLQKYGIDLPANYNYEIHINTDDVMYFVLPIETDKELSHEVIEQLSAGAAQSQSVSTLGCLLTFSSFGTVSCPNSATFSSLGLTAGSIGTASCAAVKKS